MNEAVSLPVIPGGWTVREFLLAGRSLRLTLPASPDAFLDDPDVLAANRRDDYMPYWSYLWPTSLETAVAVLQHSWPAGTAALEIGAGIALTGQAALMQGLHVSFSDYDPQALELAMFNARENGWADRGEGLLLDWRNPIPRQFPVIFGCDVIYEKRNHLPILDLLETMLAPDGEAWISDPGRHQADAFSSCCATGPFAGIIAPCRANPTRGARWEPQIYGFCAGNSGWHADCNRIRYVILHAVSMKRPWRNAARRQVGVAKSTNGTFPSPQTDARAWSDAKPRVAL